jgi:hypothetical protein
MRIRIAFLLALGGAGLAFAASPRDGRWAIDKACVPVGCFPNDAPGFPVEITVPGSYLLTSDLDVRNEANSIDATAILISARAVDLDLGGFSIRGPVNCVGEPLVCSPNLGNGVGIRVLNSAIGARVHDGAVGGFGAYGIQVEAPLARLSALRLSDHRLTAILVSGQSARIEQVAIAACGGSGVFMTGMAGSIVQSSASNLLASGLSAGAAASLMGNVVDLPYGVAYGLYAGNGSLLSGNVAAGADTAIGLGSGALAIHNHSTVANNWAIVLGASSGYTGNSFVQFDNQWASGGWSLTQNFCDGLLC